MHIKKRVLVLSNYPIRQPLHGGQKRVAAIVEEYRKVFSDVKFVAIFVREHYPVYASSDLYLTGEWANAAIHDHLTSDIKIGQAMIDSPKLHDKIKHLLLTFRPDIIEIEQVFPFIGLQPILEELDMHPKIVHSSHNIEAVMKVEIMKLGGADASTIDTAVQRIEETENYLAKHANLVATVSQEDGEYYTKRGARGYTLAPNGINPAKATPRARAHWQQYFEKQHVRQTATFIGSAHLPNVQGLEKMIGWRLGFLLPDTRLVLAGGIGRHLERHFDNRNVLDQTFWRRANSVGILSEELLSGIIEASDVLLLPIITGGGSNLKTAEAILSGKKVVGTTFAFRGYEAYAHLPNVYIADTPVAFRKAIQEALQAPLIERSPDEQKLAAQVQWKYTLERMVQETSKL